VICRRAEELFSDHADASLAPPLERELQVHLDTCSECASSYTAFEEVVSALHAWKVPAVPETLVPRLAAAATSRGIRTPPPSSAPRATPRLVATSSWLAAAAVIALLLVWRPPELASELSRKTSRSAHQAYSFGVRTYHLTERWIEDLNVLRITVGVAFEDNLERINEQLRDLELVGRGSDDDGEQSRELHRRWSPDGQTAGLIASEHFSRSPI
jgi:hypothetical protein